MALMPEQWREILSEEEMKEADELERIIDEEMRKKGPNTERGEFVFTFKPEHRVPSKRIQAEMKRRYEKSETVSHGWSSVEYTASPSMPFIIFKQ
jgi:hypothetical protein